jgi:hypothetical protein
VQKYVGKRKKTFFARGEFRAPMQGRGVIGGRAARAGGRPSATAYSLTGYGFLPTSLEFFEFYFSFSCFGVMRKFGWTKHFGRMGVTAPPFFEACPYAWEDKIFHSSWSLEILFFSKFYFL